MKIRKIALLAVSFVFLFYLAGCSVLNDQARNTPASGVSKGNQQSSYYQDFGDIMIPGKMKVEKKGTFVFQTPGLSAGVLALKGRVEANALMAFFQSNMAKDNWRLVSSFKSTVPRSMLLYQKENRWCVISIDDRGMSTYAEIWVSPTVASEETGLLK